MCCRVVQGSGRYKVKKNMKARRDTLTITPLMNNPRFEGPECIEPMIN